MPIPDYQTLMLPLLKLANTGEIKNADAIEAMCDQFNLTEDERKELLPSKTQTVIRNRFHWSAFTLKRAGLLVSPKRGCFTITSRGKEVLMQGIDKITVKFLMQFKEYEEWILRSRGINQNPDKDKEPETATPEEKIDAYLEQFENDLADDLLKRIMEREPDFFEELVVKLLVAMGYGGSVDNPGKAIGRTGDGGVDGVIDQDVLGLDRIYIQAKRYCQGNNVGAGAIRDFFGSLDNKKATKGLFVTTSDFTEDAKQTAAALSKRIVLIDGHQLTKLMIRYNVGCRIEKTLYIKKIDEDFFV